MRIHKFYEILIGTIFALFLFSACTHREEDKLLTFYYQSEESLKTKFINDISNDFESDSKVKINCIKFYRDEIKNILKTDFDLIELTYSQSFSLNQQMLFEPISKIKSIPNMDSLLNHSELYNSFIDSFAMPFISEFKALYINYDIVNKVPDYEKYLNGSRDFVTLNEKIQALTGKIGYAIILNDEENTLDCFLPFLLGNYKAIGFLIDSLSVEMLETAFKEFNAITGLSFIGTKKEVENKFALGEVAFCVTGAHLSEIINNINPSLNYRFSPISFGDKENEFVVTNPSFLLINKNSSNIEEVINYMRFLYSDSKDGNLANEEYGSAPSYYNTYVLSNHINNNQINENNLIVDPKFILFSDSQAKILMRAIEKASLSNVDHLNLAKETLAKLKNLIKLKNTKITDNLN